MTAKSESRSAVIALRSQVWILRIEENDLSTSVLSRGKMARIFSRSLTFGKKMLSAWPRWIHNPTLPVASSGSVIEIVPDFWKMTGKASDGSTSYAVLQQVPGANLEHILTDFIKERLRCKHLGGSGGHAPPRNFWIFYSLKPPHSWVSESFRQDISKCSTSNFFPFKISIYDRFSWKVANRCGSAPEFYCDFFRLRGDYLTNKSADLIKWPLFLSRLRPGKILSPVVFSISLGAMYFGMFFRVLYFGIFFGELF